MVLYYRTIIKVDVDTCVVIRSCPLYLDCLKDISCFFFFYNFTCHLDCLKQAGGFQTNCFSVIPFQFSHIGHVSASVLSETDRCFFHNFEIFCLSEAADK